MAHSTQPPEAAERTPDPQEPRLEGNERRAQPSWAAPEAPDPKQPATAAATVPGEPTLQRAYILLAAALAAAIGADRLVFASFESRYALSAYALFWIAWTVLQTGIFWSVGARRPLSWLAASSTILLGAWLILADTGRAYAGNAEYMALSVLAIPALAMMHIQISTRDFDPRQPGRAAVRWISGWVVQPFTALPRLGTPLSALWNSSSPDRKRSALRTVLLSMLFGIPVIALLIALLASADVVIDYAVNTIIGGIDLMPLVTHTAIIIALTACCYSLLWNLNARNIDRSTQAQDADRDHAPRTRPFDPTVCIIILAAVLGLYLAFSAVQFTFLFAQQGLPDGFSYAEYARQGFWQLLAVAALNFLGFGLVLNYAPRKPMLNVMLAGLVVATGVVLSSSALRLKLYIDAYGLTWLRLSSMLFIMLLAVALILCVARIRFEAIPLIAVCCALFVVWFLILGYIDPGRLIEEYNLAHGFFSVTPD
ncbi:MAG: DUF4173 domain-containing protein [Bifidobacterium psychraerophilum]|uniref:DUF4153 domain-containing protein n=1 Tax=Bifidobacterium psychraerophilum TaxID=218140 RepID=UPI0039E96B4D